MPAISVAIALLGGLTAPLPAEDSATVLLEAERFDQSGGWTIDAQFRRQMGSTYLLAAGMGQPVADATTTVQLPRDGSWRLWVRCKDWDASSPGAFQVMVNGQALGTTFGVQKRDWSWVDGGARDLAGSITLALRDLTGYYGRCDAILLTTDLNWTPPEEAAQLAAMRAALAGQPAETVVATDFVVVGGGYGGVCAALQAARLGLRTVLLQNRPLLGGNASSEINVGPGGASPHTSIFRETGLPEEIAEGRVRLPEPRSWSASIAALCAATPNLTVYLNTEATEVITARPGHLAAVAAEDVVSGRRYRFQAPLFADCTGDGTIAALAGAPFRVGQEARAEYGESHAPEVANPHTMGTSMMHRSAAMPTPQAYTPPAFAVKFTAEHFQHRHDNLANGTWWLEYGGMGDTIDDAEAIRDELLRVMYGAFDWAKNHDPATRQALANHKLVWVPTVAGKRESRRFVGEVVLTQHDVESGRLWPDRVAWGGWPIDLHPSEGIYGKEIPPFTPFSIEQPYSIPYRVLYPREVDNLFLAGRHISASHVALGSARLMQTIGTMGQAVGAAAFLCWKYDRGPGGLYPERIGELQQLLLKWDAYLPELRNEDPADLCRTARVTASSVSPQTVTGYGSEAPAGRAAPLTMARGQVMRVGEATSRVALLLKNGTSTPRVARLRVERGAPPASTAVGLVESQVPGGGRYGWVEFDLPEPLLPGEAWYLWLEADEQLAWRIGDGPGGERYWGRPGAWTRGEGLYCTRPMASVKPLGEVGPEAVIDGLKWPLADGFHQWRSDPREGLPQWLAVEFAQAVAVNTVYLTFDTNIYGRFPTAQPGAEATARDYRVLAQVAGEWREVVRAAGNWQRFRRHRFPEVTATALKLEITAATPRAEARVYELRAYRE